MAEVVHRNLESMLPQLEELESSGIFSHDEIKLIVRRRRSHEYKLLRRPARKEDFLAAVQYEMQLEQLRQHRKKRLGVTSDAENGIQNRIHSLFSRALRKFKGDLKLWMQSIDFSQQCGHKASLNRTFGKALAVHPKNPGLWVMAAKFQFEDMKDVSSARSLLQQGLRVNPHSKHLWIEYFRMELLHTDKVKKRRAVLGVDMAESEEPSSDEFLSNKAASLVYQQAITSIPNDVEFILSFLPIIQLFSDTSSLLDEVYKSAKEKFPMHPLVWQALARRQWEGLDTPLTSSQTEELEKETESVYREGLSIAGEDLTLLFLHWDCYLTWCKERLDNGPASLRKKAIRRLLAAFKQSSQIGALSECKYKEYIDTMVSLGLSQEAVCICETATKTHPSSLSLWLARLSCNEGSFETLSQLCEQALCQVDKEQTLPIWEFLISQALDKEMGQEEMESLFKASVRSSVATVCEAMSGHYLEWAYRMGGIQKAQTVYKSLLSEQQRPTPYNLYQQCISVEERALMERAEGASVSRLRTLYQRALGDYGVTHPDLWLGCIKMELSYPGGKVENVTSLHWKAVKELNPTLTADFISQYSLMHTQSAGSP